MSILNISPAARAGAHLLLGLFGPPESGKTMSALMLAAGMVPDPRKRILLDTESGRGRLYAEEIPGSYDYAELTRPFTPGRYVEALLEIEAAGYEVCVVDSISHVWAGEGGVLEQADRSGKEGLQKWLRPKLEYRKLTNRLLGSRMHLILCSRAKQPMVEGRDENGKKTLMPGAWVEVQDKALRYEMTVVLEMTRRGEFLPRKCPGALDAVFNVGGLVGVAMGERAASWVAGGDVRDPVTEALRTRAEEAADGGTESFRAFWKSLDDLQRRRLKPSIGNYESMAKSADEDAARLRQAVEDRQGLDDPFRAPAGKAPHDPETGEVTEGNSADPSTASGNVNREPEHAENEPAALDEFWSRESYEVAPRKKGNSYQWREWEAELLGRARTVPGLMAGGKLRAHAVKWLKASAQWNPGHPAFVAEFDRLTVPAADGEG